MSCVDFETLNMYLDEELDPEAQAAVEAHLHHCSNCVEQLQSLQAHHMRLLETLQVPSTRSPARTDTCLDPEALSAYASQQLLANEAVAIEQHLQTCAFCLSEVREMRQMMRLLHAEPLLDPPAHLIARARQEITAASPQAQAAPAGALGLERLGTLVIQVAQAGLTFINTLLQPDHVHLNLGGTFAPAGAFRSTSSETPAHAVIDVQETIGDLDLRLQVVHEAGETAALRLRLQRAGQPLGRKRVTLLHGGRPRASLTTSASGEVDFARLDPGDYTVRIPQEHVELGLNLQRASQA
jgi:anti-sigma factor RsiW